MLPRRAGNWSWLCVGVVILLGAGISRAAGLPYGGQRNAVVGGLVVATYAVLGTGLFLGYKSNKDGERRLASVLVAAILVVLLALLLFFTIVILPWVLLVP